MLESPPPASLTKSQYGMCRCQRFCRRHHKGLVPVEYHPSPIDRRRDDSRWWCTPTSEGKLDMRNKPSRSSRIHGMSCHKHPPDRAFPRRRRGGGKWPEVVADEESPMWTIRGRFRKISNGEGKKMLFFRGLCFHGKGNLICHFFAGHVSIRHSGICLADLWPLRLQLST